MSFVKTMDKAIKACDSLYSNYENAIRDEDYKTASKLYRQAEQDDLSDNEVEKLLRFFKRKFGKNPMWEVQYESIWPYSLHDGGKT